MPSDVDLADLWTEIRAQLGRAVPQAAYDLWLSRLTPVELTGDTLVLSGPPHVARWVSDRFPRVLQTSAAAVLGPDIQVEVITGTSAGREPKAPGGGRPTAGERDDPNPKYTFDQFVIGEGNRLAHAAALAVAELPGQAYNPLFIYGPPGVGKTHLLHSIAGYVALHGMGLTVRCSTIDSFTSGFVNALQTGSIERFKAAYRGVDVLLIDDVQFLADKTRTEEEFFHTFNALYEGGSQLVLTCDRLPRDMGALEDRLRERFESGLVSDITAPDFDTRVAILRKRAVHNGLPSPDPLVLEAIAAHVTDNVRALEGALVHVVAWASMHRAPVTVELVDHVLRRLHPAAPGRRRSVQDIQQLTCETFGLSHEELLSKNRAARLVWPRQLAMYLARELTEETLPAIGRQFGGRDHSTVVHACRRVGARIAADPDAHTTAKELTDSLRSAAGDRGD